MLLVAIVTALVAGCSDRRATPSDAGTLESTRLASAGGSDGPLFTALSPEQTGVRFENRFDWDNPRKNLYQHGYAGGGVCVGDYDGDGRPDIYLVSQVGRDRLYRQESDFRFQDATGSLPNRLTDVEPSAAESYKEEWRYERRPGPP